MAVSRREHGVSRVAAPVGSRAVRRGTRMLPCPVCPRAGGAGLWQNRLCGSIGASPGTWLGDQRRSAEMIGGLVCFQGLPRSIAVQWLTFRHAGRDFRLTDVRGRVVAEILA